MIDKSALARMQHAQVREKLGPIIEAGEAATCSIVDLEVLYSTRNREEHTRTRARRGRAYRQVALTEAIFQRAMDVQCMLAAHGRHRLPIPDLVIAAAAENADLTVLHYDADFDTIGAVTGQRMEWVAHRGSL